ncbi:hypothetical protein [Streptomyces sp. NPDC088762]|uniref:hypothetical protein n=1 Tax=Streptomyces sp. NPDC088762 TaxID=3365891 RepID=UPI00382AA6AF
MGGMKDKRQEPGKGREEQERMRRPGQNPAQSPTGQEGARGKSPEELKRRGEDEMRLERDRDEMLDDEI